MNATLDKVFRFLGSKFKIEIHTKSSFDNYEQPIDWLFLYSLEIYNQWHFYLGILNLNLAVVI